MGNYRFKLSDMIPNAWFYKLRDMNRSRNQKNIKKFPQQTSSSSSSSERQPHHLSHQRKSYYFSRDLSSANEIFYDNVGTKTRISDIHWSEPPRKSSKKRRNNNSKIISTNRVSNRASSPKLVTSSSVTAGCSCRATVESVWTKPDSTPEEYPNSPLDSSSSEENETTPSSREPCCVPPETLEKDIIIDIEKKPRNGKFQESADKVSGFDTISELNLPPIITNKNKSSKIRGNSVKIVKEDNIPKPSPGRRCSGNSGLGSGMKLRTNSPRIVNRKIQTRKSVSSSGSCSRKSMSESFAVVKTSKDPKRDFKESMVEMIIENNICGSKDLEDLLACYLSLNSDEYHDLIISVFKQIWFDVVEIHRK